MISSRHEKVSGSTSPSGLALPLALPLALLLAVSSGLGCKGRSMGGTGWDPECWDLWECNPDHECGDMIQCQDGKCRPDLEPAFVECPYGECIRDEDCVVATPYDCCNGCAQVVPRSDFESSDDFVCFYEKGQVPGPPPTECLGDCGLCQICFPQPHGVECDLGLCRPTAIGCPPTSESVDASLITLATLLGNPTQYDGRTVRMRGNVLPGLGVCTADCPSEGCCEHRMVLDGQVLLEGWPCNMTLSFWGEDACNDELTSEGVLPGGYYEVLGGLRRNASAEAPWRMEVASLTVVEPEGFGGAFDVIVTEITSETTLPTCVPPALTEGEWGRVYLGESGGMLEAVAPMFQCWWELWGTLDAEGWFSADAPVACDGWCEYNLAGQVIGNQLYAAYTSDDGQCRYEIVIAGSRVPQNDDD